MPIGQSLVHCYPNKTNANIVINPFCANAPVTNLLTWLPRNHLFSFLFAIYGLYLGLDNSIVSIYNICTINEKKNQIKREYGIQGKRLRQLACPSVGLVTLLLRTLMIPKCWHELCSSACSSQSIIETIGFLRGKVYGLYHLIKDFGISYFYTYYSCGFYILARFIYEDI